MPDIYTGILDAKKKRHLETMDEPKTVRLNSEHAGRVIEQIELSKKDCTPDPALTSWRPNLSHWDRKIESVRNREDIHIWGMRVIWDDSVGEVIAE